MANLGHHAVLTSNAVSPALTSTLGKNYVKCHYSRKQVRFSLENVLRLSLRCFLRVRVRAHIHLNVESAT